MYFCTAEKSSTNTTISLSALYIICKCLLICYIFYIIIHRIDQTTRNNFKLKNITYAMPLQYPTDINFPIAMCHPITDVTCVLRDYFANAA